MPDKKPLLCRIGWHTSVMIDGAMFTSARRCNHCLDWLDPAEGAFVEKERRLWTKYTTIGDVAIHLYRPEVTDCGDPGPNCVEHNGRCD